MKIKKTILTSVVALTLVVTPFTSIYANTTNLNTTSDDKITVLTDEDILKDLEQSFRLNATSEQKKKAKELYLKAMKKDEERAKYWNEIYKLKILKNDVSCKGEEYSFKHFAEQFKEGLSKETLKKAKDLYGKMVKAEKEGNFNDSEKIMKQLFELGVFDKPFETAEGNLDKYTFNIYSKEFKKDLSKETLKKAKDLFEKMVKAEKEGNFNDSEKIMKQLFELGVFDKPFETAEGNLDKYTFNILSKEFKKDLSKETLKKAKDLFEKMVKAEKEGNFNDSEKIMKQLFELGVFDKPFETAEGNLDKYTFNILSKEFKKDISKETLKKAKDLFEKMIKLEEEGKYDDADKIMNQINDLGVFKEGEKTETVGSKAEKFEIKCKVVLYGEITLEEFKANIVNNADQAKVNKAIELFKKAKACREEADKCWKQLLEMNIFDDGKDEK
ncbi:hypothetical protein PV797_16545 [Clostridiaceae bacterium M8S5]|nr:hypothetical protein PV797_16545 [Clostridiaceae bacterium M8S5]